MIGTELQTFITGLNGDAEIDPTLLTILLNTAKTIIEGERDWMVLRKTDKSITVTTANTWATAIDLSNITYLSHFYGEYPIRLFDGDNRIEYYRLVPYDRRLEYKNVSNTACYDENSKTLYINNVVPFSGTLWINYIIVTPDIDLTSATAQWTNFLPRFTPLLGFYAVGIHMGAVDYDTVTARMAPNQMAAMQALKGALTTWDEKKQQNAIEGNDPTDLYTYPRSNAIDRSGENSY